VQNDGMSTYVTRCSNYISWNHRCKKTFFYVFYSCHVFYVFNVFYFPHVFKNKNVENLLSMQANSEISVLHLTNHRHNCSGLVLLSTFFVSSWAYYIKGGI